MTYSVGILRKNKLLVAYWIAVLWPLFCATWLALAQSGAGIQLKAGTGICILVASVASIGIGMLMLGARTYDAKRIGILFPGIQIILGAAGISALFSAFLLVLIGGDSYCGGRFGDCGRWI